LRRWCWRGTNVARGDWHEQIPGQLECDSAGGKGDSVDRGAGLRGSCRNPVDISARSQRTDSFGGKNTLAYSRVRDFVHLHCFDRLCIRRFEAARNALRDVDASCDIHSRRDRHHPVLHSSRCDAGDVSILRNERAFEIHVLPELRHVRQADLLALRQSRRSGLDTLRPLRFDIARPSSAHSLISTQPAGVRHRRPFSPLRLRYTPAGRNSDAIRPNHMGRGSQRRPKEKDCHACHRRIDRRRECKARKYSGDVRGFAADGLRRRWSNGRRSKAHAVTAAPAKADSLAGQGSGCTSMDESIE